MKTGPWIQTVTIMPTVDAVIPLRSKTGRFSGEVARRVRGDGLLGRFGCFFALFIKEALHLIRDRRQEGRNGSPRYPRSSARNDTLQTEKFPVQTSSFRNTRTAYASSLILIKTSSKSVISHAGLEATPCVRQGVARGLTVTCAISIDHVIV
jgi:hypothetical protein